jgi:peptide chain release factor 2
MKVLRAKLFEKAEEERRKKVDEMISDQRDIGWGNQIRSYVLHPYNLVKDHRTGFETSNVQVILDGQLQEMIDLYLESKIINRPPAGLAGKSF